MLILQTRVELAHSQIHGEENKHLQHDCGCGDSDEDGQFVIHAIFGALRNVRGRAFDLFAGRFPISLAACFVGRANLVLLLVQIFAALVGPGTGVLARLAGTFVYGVRKILRHRANAPPRLVSRLGSVENSNRRADAQTRQKPQETTAVAFRHNYLLTKNFTRRDVSTRNAELQTAERALRLKNPSSKARSARRDKRCAGSRRALRRRKSFSRRPKAHPSGQDPVLPATRGAPDSTRGIAPGFCASSPR